MNGQDVQNSCDAAISDLIYKVEIHQEDFSLAKAINVPKDLPDALRTHHWYNDLHHAMFLILFVNTFNAIRSSNMGSVENYLDNITLYLYIHFIMEEEGMVYAIKHHALEEESVQDHTMIHIKFLDWWQDNIYQPFKDGNMTRVDIHNGLASFCDQLIDHIDTIDMQTYGLIKRDEAVSRNEISHLSKTGLPLSPFMDGAEEVMKIVAPHQLTKFAEGSLSPQARNPLKQLHLSPRSGNIGGGTVASFSDRLYQKVGTAIH